MTKIRIISRKSRLAIWQTEYVAKKILSIFPNTKIEIIKINTLGDNLLKSSLELIESKDLFIKELESKLLNKTADIAVHSLKDIPHKINNALTIGSLLKRDNPFDAFISLKYPSIENLPYRAIVGTSSLRRKIQLLNIRPDIKILPIRGNVETRLKKMVNQQYDAIILSSAGLIRLNLKYYITKILPLNVMIPATGQGVIAVECLKSNNKILNIIRKLEDIETKICCLLEREILASLEGDCKSPLGIFSYIKNNKINVSNLISDYHGSKIVRLNYNYKLNNRQLIKKLINEKFNNLNINDILKKK